MVNLIIIHEGGLFLVVKLEQIRQTEPDKVVVAWPLAVVLLPCLAQDIGGRQDNFVERSPILNHLQRLRVKQPLRHAIEGECRELHTVDLLIWLRVLLRRNELAIFV